MLPLQLPRDSLNDQMVTTGTGKTEMFMGGNEGGTKDGTALE